MNYCDEYPFVYLSIYLSIYEEMFILPGNQWGSNGSQGKINSGYHSHLRKFRELLINNGYPCVRLSRLLPRGLSTIDRAAQEMGVATSSICNLEKGNC